MGWKLGLTSCCNTIRRYNLCHTQWNQITTEKHHIEQGADGRCCYNLYAAAACLRKSQAGWTGTFMSHAVPKLNIIFLNLCVWDCAFYSSCHEHKPPDPVPSRAPAERLSWNITCQVSDLMEAIVPVMACKIAPTDFIMSPPFWHRCSELYCHKPTFL